MSEVAVYTVTHNKLALAEQSFASLRERAGVEYDHFIADSGSTDGTADYVKDYPGAWTLAAGVNYGQHILLNKMLDQIEARGRYRWLLSWDPDAVALTDGFLAKLIEVASEFIERRSPSLVAPTITRLEAPPPSLAVGEDLRCGYRYEVVAGLGKVCRLHPARFFWGPDGRWRHNERLPVSFGETFDVLERANELEWGLVRVLGVEVEHALGHSGQADAFPDEFGWEREVARSVGYGL